MTKDQEALKQKMLGYGLFVEPKQLSNKPTVQVENISLIQEDMFLYMAQLFKKQREDISQAQKAIINLTKKVADLEAKISEHKQEIMKKEISEAPQEEAITPNEMITILQEKGYHVYRNIFYAKLVEKGMIKRYGTNGSNGFKPTPISSGYLIPFNRLCGVKKVSKYCTFKITKAGQKIISDIFNGKKS